MESVGLFFLEGKGIQVCEGVLWGCFFFVTQITHMLYLSGNTFLKIKSDLKVRSP